MLNDYVMFVVNIDDGKKFFWIDGIVVGIEEVLQLYDVGSFFFNSLCMIFNGEKLFFFYYFNNNFCNLWVMDGIIVGIQLLKVFDFDINGLFFCNVIFFGDFFIFIV